MEEFLNFLPVTFDPLSATDVAARFNDHFWQILLNYLPPISISPKRISAHFLQKLIWRTSLKTLFMSVSFKINPSIKTQFSSENLEVSKCVVIKIDTFSVLSGCVSCCV